MSDLIRRYDALKAVDIWESDWVSTDSAIRALPAVQPHVNETPKSEHDTANMLTLTAERDRLAAAVDAVMADRKRIIGERDRLRLYAGHDDDCTINRYPSAGACSCGLRAAFPATPPERTCPSCRDSLDLPSGDGCAIMTAHEPTDPRAQRDTGDQP
jgi:hypothetical protein